MELIVGRKYVDRVENIIKIVYKSPTADFGYVGVHEEDNHIMLRSFRSDGSYVAAGPHSFDLEHEWFPFVLGDLWLDNKGNRHRIASICTATNVVDPVRTIMHPDTPNALFMCFKLDGTNNKEMHLVTNITGK